MKISPRSRLFRILVALWFSAAGASGTVTLAFSLGATAQASNWGNSVDAGGELMAWGVIIDTAGNGLHSTYLPSSIDYTLVGTRQSLSDAEGFATDDVLFLSTSAMSAALVGIDGAVAGMNRVGAVTGLPIGFGIDPGDSFVIAWFDRTQQGAVTPVDAPGHGHRFGTFADASFVMPFDAETWAYTAPFVGVDPLKTMNGTLVPEPSAALLGLAGLAGFCLRRRR